MKKLTPLIIALVVLGGLGYFASKLLSSKGISNSELIEFAIENVEEVDKIKITDGFGHEITLVKQKDGIWTDENGGCIEQSGMKYILEAFKNIEFRGYLPDSSHDKFTKLMSAQHTKVDIFTNGSWNKTWFIGPSSQDHYGQIMLLDSKEHGKSSYPVEMKVKGTQGIIEPRFYADHKKWMCSKIFGLKRDEIKKVDVKFNDNKMRSFSVTKDGYDMKVYQQGKLLENVDTANIFRYLNNYEKIHFEKANYVLNEAQVDSVKAMTPFFELSLEEANGTVNKIKGFRLGGTQRTDNGYVTIESSDENSFWCELQNGELVKCQYFVFNPLLLGHIYFPLDLTGLEGLEWRP